MQGDKWRLSLISEIAVRDKNDKFTTQETNPKRFTYLLGPGETVRTAADRLDIVQQAGGYDLPLLIEAFSVEKLNKDFFRDYKIVIPNTPTKALSIAAQLNGTLGILQRELIGLTNLGDGALKFSADDVRIFLLVAEVASDTVKTAFLKIADREQLDLEDELVQSDRRELDNIIFDALGLTTGERDAVYEAVIDLVSKRLQRARTITG